MVVAIIAILAWEYWPREKPSVTLADGTVITVEKVEIVSLWEEKFKCWLMETFKWDYRFFDAIGWKTKEDNYPIQFDSNWRSYECAVVTEISINPPGKYLDDSSRWPDAKDTDIVQIEGVLQYGSQGYYIRPSLRCQAGKPGRFRAFDVLEKKEAFHTLRFSCCRLVGPWEHTDIPLAEKPVSPPSGVASASASRENRATLPQECYIHRDEYKYHIEKSGYQDRETYEWLDDDLTIRLESLPVQFGQNNGVKIFQKGKEVTADYHIERKVTPFSTEQLLERDWIVEFLLYPKSSTQVPPEKRLLLSQVTIPAAGQYLEWKSEELNPGFGKYRLFLFSPGAYCISTNYEHHDGFEEGITDVSVDIAAVSRSARREQFAAALARPGWRSPMHIKELSRTAFTIKGNRRYCFIETPVPIFCTIPLGWPDIPEHAKDVLSVWQESRQKWDRTFISVDSWLPVVALDKDRVRPDDNVQFDLHRNSPVAGYFNVSSSEVDREAWTAYWAKEKIKISTNPLTPIQHFPNETSFFPVPTETHFGDGGCCHRDPDRGILLAEGKAERDAGRWHRDHG
ncbi:MAG: hypothetical protein LBV12_06750 [Puniceicoccales bacterium]|nr:hypothetical protein [Puniceicoccales bacterium]